MYIINTYEMIMFLMTLMHRLAKDGSDLGRVSSSREPVTC
jgi:hypothetical protein